MNRDPAQPPSDTGGQPAGGARAKAVCLRCAQLPECQFRRMGNGIAPRETPSFNRPRVASTMLQADDISIALTDSLGASPDPTAGSQVFIFGPSGFLTFNVVSRAGFTPNNYQFLVVTGGTLTGDDFEVESGLTLGFSGTTSLQPGPTENREVWARINERGAETGILAINTTETVSVVTETAELVIRFIDPETYERLLSIRDDLGRVWEIRSFRSLEDRRYLALECQRNAT